MSQAESSARVVFELAIAIFPSFDRGRGLPCPACGCVLELDQPDSGNPDRLLGSCAACEGWHIVELSPDSDAVLLVSLPGGDAVRSALRRANT